MALTPKAGIPCSSECGDTLTFTETFADYPTADWSARLYLSLNGAAVLNQAATETNGAYLFELTPTMTEALTPGIYDYAIYATNGSGQRERAKRGQISFTPNLAASQTPSFAQAQVTRLQTVLAEFAATTKVSVSFNGQSFQRANIAQYEESLRYWESRVLAERGQRQRIYSPVFGGCR